MTVEGTVNNSDMLMRSYLELPNEPPVRIPDAAKLELLEARGHPFYGDEIREGDTARLPVGAIVRAKTGANSGVVFVKAAYQGEWYQAGSARPFDESALLATGAVVVWLPEGATR